jgi:DNA-binding transcriptional ArsR family regulator
MCAGKLSALAAPERLRIVRYLCAGPRNVTEIAEMLRAPVVNVSHHLQVLRLAGIIRNRKQGRFVLYSLSPGLLQLDDQDDVAHLNLGCCRLEVRLDGDAPPADEPADGSSSAGPALPQ